MKEFGASLDLLISEKQMWIFNSIINLDEDSKNKVYSYETRAVRLKDAFNILVSCQGENYNERENLLGCLKPKLYDSSSPERHVLNLYDLKSEKTYLSSIWNMFDDVIRNGKVNGIYSIQCPFHEYYDDNRKEVVTITIPKEISKIEDLANCVFVDKVPSLYNAIKKYHAALRIMDGVYMLDRCIDSRMDPVRHFKYDGDSFHEAARIIRVAGYNIDKILEKPLELMYSKEGKRQRSNCCK